MAFMVEGFEKFKSTIQDFEAQVVNAFTGAVADALTVPDYVQSAALLSIEGGQSDKGTDDALQALLDLRVVDSAFYCVLAASPSHTFHPDPAKGGELRWLNLSLPKAFSPPQMTTTRKGYRVMLATTLEARWLVLDCGGVTGSERCLARSHWAKDGFDMRNAPQRGTHVNGSTSRRRRSGQAGETEAEDSDDENGLNSDDDRQPANEDSGGCSTSNSTNSTAAERNGRLTGVHSGVRDIAEECWEAIEDEFVAPAEQALATAERALETADSRLRELREQPWMVDLVPLARERRKWAATCRDEAAAPWRVSGHGVGGAAAVLVALRLAERFKAKSQHDCSTSSSYSSSNSSSVSNSSNTSSSSSSSNSSHRNRRSRSAVSASVPVAGCVTFGATKCLAGNSARRAAKRLRGVLLHVTQGDDIRAHWPPPTAMPPSLDQPLASFFPLAAAAAAAAAASSDSLVHPGPTLLLPSAIQRRRLSPEAAAHPSNAKGWLLRSDVDSRASSNSNWLFGASLGAAGGNSSSGGSGSGGGGLSVPGGARAVTEAWGPSGVGVASSMGALARKSTLVDVWQDPAGYLLALSALAHCQADPASGSSSSSSSASRSSSASAYLVPATNTRRNGPIETARLAFRTTHPTDLAAFEASPAGEAAFFWECASDYLTLLSLNSGARTPQDSSLSSSSSGSRGKSGRGERNSSALGAAPFDKLSASERQALIKASDRLQRTIATAEAAAASRSDQRKARLEWESSQEADLASKLQQRHVTARRAQGERPSKQRSAAAATAAEVRRTHRAEAAAAEEEASRRGRGSNTNKSILGISNNDGSSRGDSGHVRRGVTFEDIVASADDEVNYAGRQPHQTSSDYDEPYEETYHTAYINGRTAGSGSHVQGRTSSAKVDEEEMSFEEEAVISDEGAASGDDEGRRFGANAFDGHL